MSVQLTSILQNAVTAACQDTAGSPVRVKPDLREMKKTCYGKNIIKKMPVQSILALKINFESGVIVLNLHQTFTFLLDCSYP